MSSSLTYLTLKDDTPIAALLHSSSLPGTSPTGELTIGALVNDARLYLTFTSYGQVQDLIRELTQLRDQWRQHAAQQRRQADFGDLIPDAAGQSQPLTQWELELLERDRLTQETCGSCGPVPSANRCGFCRRLDVREDRAIEAQS